jgi:flagellar basal body-associated protein FliL
MLIVMIVILVLLVGLGAAIGFYFFTSKSASSTKNSAAQVTSTDITSTVAVSAGDAITCNIIADGDSSSKLVRFSVTLYIKDDATFNTLLTNRQAEVRSEIEKIAKSKTSKELSELNTEDVLGNEIKKKLNKLYNTDKIVKVACYDLITQ